jgi:hypothetical protein
LSYEKMIWRLLHVFETIIYWQLPSFMNPGRHGGRGRGQERESCKRLDKCVQYCRIKRDCRFGGGERQALFLRALDNASVVVNAQGISILIMPFRWWWRRGVGCYAMYSSVFVVFGCANIQCYLKSFRRNRAC